MSRILFEKEKEGKKQWGKKGKAVERRGRCRKLGRILDKSGKKLRLKASERYTERRIMCTGFGVAQIKLARWFP